MGYNPTGLVVQSIDEREFCVRTVSRIPPNKRRFRRVNGKCCGGVKTPLEWLPRRTSLSHEPITAHPCSVSPVRRRRFLLWRPRRWRRRPWSRPADLPDCFYDGRIPREKSLVGSWSKPGGQTRVLPGGDTGGARLCPAPSGISRSTLKHHAAEKLARLSDFHLLRPALCP